MEQSGKKRKKRKRMTGKMQAVLWVVFCLFLVGTLVVMVRVVIVGSNTSYAKAALSQKVGNGKVLKYKRGEILDRNGTILAKSDKVYHMILDARLLMNNEKYLEPTIRALSNVYGYSQEELRALIEERKESAYYRLRKNMTYEEMAALSEYEKNLPKTADGKPHEDKGLISGVTFEEEYLRSYPFGELASHVIGFAKADGEGTYGIEQRYNELLTGTDGRIYSYYDGELAVQEEKIPAQDGKVIVSTIDANLQRIVQKNTEAFLDNIGAKNAGVLMMETNSGEVLAMQSNYSYDLNEPRSLEKWYTEEEIAGMDNETYLDALYKVWRNFCISDSYEPGSTFKPFTVAAALEEAVITTEEKFLCNGGEQVADYFISCHNEWGHGLINAAQSIMYSCNDALMEIAKREGRGIFSRYQRRFLFGKLTGIDLPGEVPGILMKEEQLNDTELATSSFGMSFNTTMVQLGAAFSSMVNGGIYYEPHVVKEIRNADGVVLEKIAPRAICNTVSKETSEFLRDAFYFTVEEGTAKAAKVDGYLIGGKTGTAQKLPRSEGKYLVSFIGCIPADNPQVMIYVVIDEAADEELQDRASIASGLAADILKESLPYLRIYPDKEIEYPDFCIDKKDVEMQTGEIGDTGVVYDPEKNEGNMKAIPDGME